MHVCFKTQVLQAMEELRALLQLKASRGALATTGSRAPVLGPSKAGIPPATPTTTLKKLPVHPSFGTAAPAVTDGNAAGSGQAAGRLSRPSLSDSPAGFSQPRRGMSRESSHDAGSLQQQPRRASTSRGSLILGDRAPAGGHSAPGSGGSSNLISSADAGVQHGSRRHSGGAMEAAIEAAAAGKGLCKRKQPPSLVKGALKLLGALAGRPSKQG